MNSLFENFTYLEVYRLANIKSAKKRILVNETKAARNKSIKSKVKTSVKKVETAVAQKDAASAKTALQAAITEISKAGSKGVYHKNTVARKISRLSKAVNDIA
ncbi:ribosomal protein S20 [Clostridium sp. D5]|nr:ribosomal protein S20 [Clostridium sp. D5]